MKLANGEPYWYSPILERAALSVPAQPSGGFCCEEMGAHLGWDTALLLPERRLHCATLSPLRQRCSPHHCFCTSPHPHLSLSLLCSAALCAGLGKTVEMLGLILANPAPPPAPQQPKKDSKGLIKSR